jgi:uncharacterized membrane protein YeiB
MAAGESVAVPAVAPVRTRVAGVDVARGLALIGMAATHMLAVTDWSDGSLTPVGWLAAGKASALFAVLAGVSLSIVTGATTPYVGVERRRARVSISARSGLLLLLGLLLAQTSTPVAVILAYYGVLFVLALPFLGLGWRTLASMALAWALVAPQVSFLLRGALPEPVRGQVDLVMLLTDPISAARTLLLTGYYPALTWLTYLLAGLAIGRLDLRTTRVARWLVVVGAALAVSAWALSALLLELVGAQAVIGTDGGQLTLHGAELNRLEWFGTTSASAPTWLLVAGPHSGTTFDLLLTTGTAMAVLGACLLLARGAGVMLTRPVAAVGSMTLTLYTLHCLSLLTPIGNDYAPGWYAAQVVIALVAAPLWLWRFRRGPLEAIVHDISTVTAERVVPPVATAAAHPA